MDASSSSRSSTAKAEQSPSNVVGVVAELEAMTMVAAEGASTSGRTEYYSARCEAMMRSRDQFTDDVAMRIEFSKSHCSEVVRLEVAPQSAEEEKLNRENREVLKQLSREYPDFFWNDLARGDDLGRMIAKGGQAEIYEIVNKHHFLMKVFERGTSLQALQGSWPLPILNKDVRQCIISAGMLEDGRFAFVMRRCWCDLRQFIDDAMLKKNVDDVQGSPFHMLRLYPIDLMLGIAKHMRNLHEKGISHRDLKASNILLSFDYLDGFYPFTRQLRGIIIADFECSIGVLGTGFWRAPEILLARALGNVNSITNEQWKKADVYSFGMICFELVTGGIPFDGELENMRANHQLVIKGKRPQLPSDLDGSMKDLITKCWESNPSSRPTFYEIAKIST